MASGELAGAGSLCIVYPLDYARTRLASDVGGGKAQFSGLADCLKKTVASGGIGSVYNSIGISVVGIIPYRGVYVGLFDTLLGSIHTKSLKTIFSVLVLSFYVLSHQPSVLDILHIHST